MLIFMNIEILGFIGSALLFVGYLPQIYELYTHKCAWGISLTTWGTWLCSSLLLMIYAFTQNDWIFFWVQAIEAAAATSVLVLLYQDNLICPYHFEERKKIGVHPHRSKVMLR